MNFVATVDPSLATGSIHSRTLWSEDPMHRLPVRGEKAQTRTVQPAAEPSFKQFLTRI